MVVVATSIEQPDAGGHYLLQACGDPARFDALEWAAVAAQEPRRSAPVRLSADMGPVVSDGAPR